MSPPTPESPSSGTASLARAALASPQPANPSAPNFEWVWGGSLQRVFVLDGLRAWTAEDGSRIRCTSDAGRTWTFQDTPAESRGSLETVFFLADGLHGWAVSDDGLVLGTDSGGARGWTILNPVPIVDPTAPLKRATLFDVYFADTQNGWLAGLHLLKRTIDQFDRLYAESAKRAKICTLAIHPYISGQPHRIKYLEQIYDYVNKHEGVLHWNGEQILDWYRSIAKIEAAA